MNRDDIARLAEENGIVIVGEAMFRFAALVAAAEREECAKVAARWDADVDTRTKPSEAIRARGDK